ncbi:MAG: hypothetical protein IJO16_01805 [Clostridia bacterium]|nr:hypothetical protein [Clostridia bacterium]MBQ6932976.1 hypothetical protein [Clostridia bacterium]
MGGIIISNYYVFVLYLIAIGILIWEIASFFKFRNKVIVPAKVPAQNILFAILAVLMCYIILSNYGAYTSTYVLCGMFVLAFIIFSQLACGVTEDGFVIQGMLSRFDRMRYYNVDTQTAQKPRIRVGLGFSEKYIEVEEDKVELIKAYMFKFKVPDFEEYVELKKLQRQRDLEERRRKEEAKGKKK